MGIASLSLALMAGILSTLSPCVLPLLPIVLGTAAAEHRLGPMALAAGLALSFTVIGLFVATIGFAIGFDGEFFRAVAAALLLAIGLVLAVPLLGEKLAVAAGPVGNWASTYLGGLSGEGLSGQFGLGVLLGAVWSPCVGPTLGAASLLASQGKQLGEVAVTMAVFGVGAALPLLVLGMLSREAMLRWRAKAMGMGRGLRRGLGLLLIVVAIAILSGLDKQIEAWLVAISPDWLTRLTTRY